MQSLQIQTKEKKQVLDLTRQINQLVKQSSVDSGWVRLFVTHTTCCLTTADLDPGTDQDYLEAIAKIFPSGDYRHPHNPDHVGDHIMSSIIGPEVNIPIENGQLKLGTWQKVVMIELNGPRTREMEVDIRPN
jgi:secondary thiamine-phosphate synthase enzyme